MNRFPEYLDNTEQDQDTDRHDDVSVPVAVEAIKQGEFVRRKADSLKTYKRGEYDRSTKRYSLIDCDDHCREIFVKRGTLLHVDFGF